MGSPHAAAGSAQSHRATGVGRCIECSDGGVLEHAHAEPDRSARQAQAVLQWVQMTRQRVVQPAVKTRAGDPLRQLLRRDPLGVVGVQRLHAHLPGLQLTRLAVADRQAQITRAPVAIDLKARATLLDQRQRLDRHRPHAARLVEAELRFDGVLLAGKARQRLAAVAPGGAPADLLCFKQHHVVAAVGQFDRRRQPSQATADDGDIALEVCGERRRCCRTLHRGVVVRVARQIAIGVEEAHGRWGRQQVGGSSVRPPALRPSAESRGPACWRSVRCAAAQ